MLWLAIAFTSSRAALKRVVVAFSRHLTAAGSHRYAARQMIHQRFEVFPGRRLGRTFPEPEANEDIE
ncbi:MAG: hypothetical protein AAF492_27710, partial [Verrucomicrobiota bacterium]